MLLNTKRHACFRVVRRVAIKIWAAAHNFYHRTEVAITSVFLKGFGDFQKKRQICSDFFSQKSHKKNVFNFKIPGFSQKKTFWAPKSPFFAQNPGIFTKKNAGRFAAGFSHKKKHTKERRFAPLFHKKKRYSFLCVKIFVKKTLLRKGLEAPRLQ